MSEKSLIKAILDKDYSTLKDDIESVVAQKIVSKIQEKKQVVTEKINNMKFFGKEENKDDKKIA